MDALSQTPTIGATPHEDGVTFCVLSRHATQVELCLFDPAEPSVETARYDLSRIDRDSWLTDVPGLEAGALYGYRVHGEHAPARGHRFEPSKLLIDPAARATTGPRRWHASHQPGATDSAPFMPRSVVVSPEFDWRGDRPPRTQWSDTVLYETHVKGLTTLHPEVPAELRGRYLGLASPPIIDHLQRLGVTALQLLPVQQSYDEPHLVRRGLTNYWGYAPLALFAPDGRYASGSRGEQVLEFREMVRRLHVAGIEVLLDVVFNHTAEGNDSGPVLSLRGLDNSSFYRLHPSEPARGIDWTGCGNTLDLRQPLARRLVLDCLRYWVEELHVDGFRFDLGVTLDRAPGFMDALAVDPILREAKLIVEPWDLGPDGYRLGRFGAPWVEWNDTFRSAARRTWRGDPGVLPDLATRLAGSSDVFDPDRGPLAGINYVACHDGFTLADLTAYRSKRNEANGEENRDGSDSNHSVNWGHEGPTDDPDILRARDQAARNLLATVALSQGVPMLAHGDELGRTQRGNNNAYCQDGPITWTSWDHGPRERARIQFTAAAFAVRRELRTLRRASFLTGAEDARGQRDVLWFGPDGEELHGKGWGATQALGMRLSGLDHDPPLLLLLNPSPDAISFALPAGGPWDRVLDTADVECPLDRLHAVVQRRSLLLLRGV
jgi:isoamylase